VNKGDDGGWKRGEMVKGLSLIGRQDGVKRYDRATLVSLFEKGNTSPECMSTFYPSFCNEERSPKSVKPIKGKQKKEAEIDPEDSKEFRKGLEDENVFKYIPGRLENAEDTATIVSKAKSILNKLTPEKFEKLAQDFMNVGLKNSRALLDKAVETIVSKAQMEENFCFMYADLCVKLMNEWTDPISLLKDESNSNEENSEKADEEGMSQGKFFRNLILHRCSHEFDIDREKALEEIQNRDISEEDKLEQAILLKKRYTGHMRFIGEMYVKKMISHGIMHSCITDLLKGNNEEETLVCLCKLMETIGSKLEQHEIIKKKKKKATDPPEENSIDMQSHFDEIQIISKEHPSSRIRFMMKDLIELRENNWQSRRQNEKPKTLEEIRAEAEKEQGGSGKSTPRVPSGNLGPRSFSSSDNLTQDARNQQGFRRMNSAPNQPNSPRQGGQPIHRTNSAGNIINKSNNGNEKKEWNTKGGESKWGNKQNSDTKGSSKNNDLHKAPALTRQESLEADYLDVDASQPGFDGQVSKDDLKKLKPILEEYLAGLTDVEAVQEINELIHANGMSDVVKSSFLFVVDRKDSDRDAILKLLLCLHSSKLLSKTVAIKGIYGILDDFDDCIIDSPLIGLYLAKLLAGLVTNDVLDLNFLGQIPEENNFAVSPKAADFIIATLSEVEKVKGEEVIKLFKEININILKLVNPPPRQTPEQALEEIATKYKISTSLKSSILS
jgi:translation initiation factor 4G